MIQSPWLRVAFAALAGAVGACGLAPLELWPLSGLALLVLSALFVAATNTRQAAWIGWAFGTGWFGHGLIWIIEPFMVDPERHAWMAPFALVFLAGGLALFWAFAFWAAKALGRNWIWEVFLLIAFWSLAEFARAYVLTGFPWAALGQIWAGAPTFQLLALIGPQGLALVTLLATLPLGAAVVARSRTGILMGLVPAILLSVASVAVAPPKTPVLTTGQVVRVIQPNAPQHQKWDPNFIPTFFNRQLDYTSAAPPVDLIIWPESAVPVLFENAGPTFDRIAKAANGASVVLGIQRFDGAKAYNSLAFLDAQGQLAAQYDKHHLVPFGEYIPLAGLAARFGLFGLASTGNVGYSAGPGPRVLDLGKLGLALPLICYEAVFPQDVNGASERPDYLLQITNDAWFGTRSGPYQHLVQARMRAVEQGLPMLRSANTGISAVIDPLGRITKSIPLGTAGYADAPLPQALPATLYARTGDWPVFLLLLVALAAGLASQSRITRQNNH
ncbi:apolipoprotein N-acyltransferase [Falsiphaeobacter marinintestinus]|uniref:apolipoprotein N-acyltransferase n=1 Tax=Falsiphaeobacter marinintestinus TaxID=1492905 RepID=UPI0011B5BA4B|nr:apolipoprotein N-acyltransferase [Phaeobacter marinintestinus]